MNTKATNQPHVDPAHLADLGVTACTSCMASTEVVGPLTTDGFYEGYCRHCTHKLAVHDILAEEARDLLRSWIDARYKSYSRDELEGALEEGLDMLMDRIDKAESDAAQA